MSCYQHQIVKTIIINFVNIYYDIVVKTSCVSGTLLNNTSCQINNIKQVKYRIDYINNTI